jgi:peptide-methionine (S)-S-oxide reductase
MASDLATLGGGCFWCIEAAMQQLKGVSKVVSGYAGGATKDPTYEDVCGGSTGHAEVVQVTFDPAVLPYKTLLQAFFTVHDPTTPDRQGADVGTQYRSVIFTHTPGQASTAKALIAELQGDVFDDPIVTQVLPAPTFYPAEDYHQDYYNQNSSQGYCSAVIRPKLAKLRKAWAPLLK